MTAALVFLLPALAAAAVVLGHRAYRRATNKATQIVTEELEER